MKEKYETNEKSESYIWEKKVFGNFSSFFWKILEGINICRSRREEVSKAKFWEKKNRDKITKRLKCF